MPHSYRTLAILIALCLFRSADAASPWNFVFILVDDLGKLDMGCEGSTFYETPNIDGLALRSMRFENGYSACQVCSPSRAAIQTGKSPSRVGITDYINPAGRNQPEQWSRNTKLLPAAFQKQLALDETTIAESLKEMDYHTFFAGKWHLGGEGYWPTEQGYDINIGGHQAGTPPGGYFAPYRNPVLEGPPGEHLPIRLGRETASYIRSRQSKDQPFFAMLSFYSVHSPIQTTQSLWSKYQSKADRLGLVTEHSRFLFDRTQEVRQVQDNPLYAGMMESLDTSVGLVLEAVEDAGLADNTVIIFTSDNGGVSSGDGYATAALPLRGGKGRQWEGGIRQPFYIHVPNVTDGSKTSAFATGVDFFPTIVDLAGGSVPDDIDGQSLVPTLHGESQPPRALYWHYPHYGNQGGEPSAIMRDGDWKLIHYYEDGRNELYDLASDIGETTDLSAENGDRVLQMHGRLKDWLAEAHAVYPSPNPKYDAAKHAASLQQAQQVRMKNREEQHRAFLNDDYQPQGGWWRDKKRREAQSQ